MKVDTLLSKLLAHEIRVEDIRLTDGTRLIISSAPPPFPYIGACWHVLPLSSGQDEVTREEIEALLRHVWHGELDFFEGEPDKVDEDAEYDVEPGGPSKAKSQKKMQ